MYVVKLALIAVLYVLLAWVSIHFGTLAGQVSPIWLPSGVTLTILLLGGVGLWPGIAIGAIALQLWLGVSWWGAACIALGEVAEATIAWYLLRKRLRFHFGLTRVKDIIFFVTSTVLASIPVNATIGTATLCLLGIEAWSNFVTVWSSWWIANSAGCLIAAPAILVWGTAREGGSTVARKAEAWAIGLVMVTLLWLIFGSEKGPAFGRLEYAVFPPLIWACLRFGQRGAVTCALVTGCAAVWATINGNGPFVEEPVRVSLLLLQSFLMTLAMTGLTVGATTHERTLALRQLARANAGLERRVMERTSEVARTNAFMNAVLDNADVGIAACDSDGNVTLVNRWMRDLFGVEADDQADGALGMATQRRFVSPNGSGDVQTPWFRALQGEVIRGEELLVQGSAPGDERNLLTNAQAIRNNNGEILGSVAIAHDITEQKKAEAQLRHSAHHDALTGLPNRSAFLDAVGRALAYAKRRPEYRFAVLFMDLDGFKAINDTYGHYHGDLLLVHVAGVLTKCVRTGDMVARLGGDEFTVLLDHLLPSDGGNELATIAERILNSMKQPIKLEDAEVTAGASIGLAHVQAHHQDATEILAEADEAMYQAKRAGKGRYIIYGK